jgi:hypothetical protein
VNRWHGSKELAANTSRKTTTTDIDIYNFKRSFVMGSQNFNIQEQCFKIFSLHA